MSEAKPQDGITVTQIFLRQRITVSHAVKRCDTMR